MGDYQRFYLILRPAQGQAGGHARLEQREGRAHISLSLHGVEERCRLRILLLAGLEPQDAVIDLGSLETDGSGRGSFSRGGIMLPSRVQISACHALALCLDWPQSRLVLAAPLDHDRPAAPWRVQQAVNRYLTAPVEAPPPTPDPPREPEAPTPPCLPKPPAVDPSPAPWVDALPPLRWPEAFQELKLYFDLLIPTAPFDAPGWRFVKVPLPHGGPGPFCYVGVAAQGNRITQAIYALPAETDLPPSGLEGWQPQTGPGGKNYWLLHQSTH